MRKPAQTEHPVHELIRERYSPYWFADRAVTDADLRSLLEALRWSASSYNEQPWVYLLARRENAPGHAKMISCLVEGNQTWAASAPVLMLSLTRRRRRLDGEPNPAAEHDLGLAAATLTFEATSRGIFVHQMSGILPERIRELYRVPDSHDPLTAIALGYPAEADAVPERYRDRQLRERSRQPLEAFVYEGGWEQPAKVLG